MGQYMGMIQQFMQGAKGAQGAQGMKAGGSSTSGGAKAADVMKKRIMARDTAQTAGAVSEKARGTDLGGFFNAPEKNSTFGNVMRGIAAGGSPNFYMKMRNQALADQKQASGLAYEAEQIKAAKFKNALNEDIRESQKLTQKFQISGGDPTVAAEIYNQFGFGDEIKFDQSHFESTKNGGREATPSIISPQLRKGLPEDQAVGQPAMPASEGEYLFKRGYYKRDHKGNMVKDSDGNPLFVETGKPITYKSKQDMIDNIVGATLDPKVRMAKIIGEQEYDLWSQKETQKRETDKLQHGQRMQEIEAGGKAQLEVAKEQSRGRGIKQTGKGGMTEAQKKQAEERELKDLRSSLEPKVNKALIDDFEMEDAPKQRFSFADMRTIKKFQSDPKHDTFMKKLKGMSNRDAMEKVIDKLAQKFKLPADYVLYLKKTTLPAEK